MTLLVFGLHGLEADMRAGRVTTRTDLPHGSSVGKDATGQYRTASLKEYIHQLCAEHAESFYRDIIRQGTGSEIQAPSPFLQLVQHMKGHDFGCHIGHDG